jgi:hypothetical protein
MDDVFFGNLRNIPIIYSQYYNYVFKKQNAMRTTLIFAGICVACIAFMIFISTKKGQKWMRKIDGLE